MIEWILTVLFGIILWIFLENNNRRNMPPGPLKWPIFGNTLQVKMAHRSAGQAYYKLSQKYGDMMSLKDGAGESVVLSTPELVNELYSRDDLSDRHGGEGGLDRNMNRNMGMIFASGKVWSDLRRFTIRTLRDFGFGKSFTTESALNEELEYFVRHLRTVIQSSDGIVNMDGVFALSSLNIIWKLIMGVRFEYDDPKIQKYLKCNEEFFRSQSFVSGWSLIFPFLREWFPERTGRTAILKSVGALQDFIRTLIHECQETQMYKTDPQNFVDVFLAKIYSESKNPETVFTEDQLLITILDIFQAGAETTANTLGFAILFLILNPEVQQKLQKEIDNAILNDNENLLSKENKSRMIYTQATILEIHRCSVIIPLPIAHKVTNDFKFRGFLFEKGTSVFANLYAIFMDEKVWGDPENFRPERFINADGKINEKEAKRIIPFLTGKRFCPGETIAEPTIYMFLITLLKHFTFSTIPNQGKPSLEPLEGFAFAPKPFSAIIKERK